MPTIDRVAGCRVFFYSKEDREPPHVHVRSGNGVAKFWLVPVRLARARGLRHHELNWIRRIIEAREAKYLEAWNEHFADGPAGVEGVGDG